MILSMTEVLIPYRVDGVKYCTREKKMASERISPRAQLYLRKTVVSHLNLFTVKVPSVLCSCCTFLWMIRSSLGLIFRGLPGDFFLLVIFSPFKHRYTDASKFCISLKFLSQWHGHSLEETSQKPLSGDLFRQRKPHLLGNWSTKTASQTKCEN